MGSLPEAALRIQLLQAARRADREGLVAASLGNLSVRCPNRPERFLITPSGVPYARMRSGDIVAMDVDGTGQSAPGEPEPSSEWRVHAAIYRLRSDVQAIIHTHALHAQAFSFRDRPLATGTEELAVFVGGDVPVAAYAPSGTDALAEQAARALADRQAVLLARHGTVSVGRTLEAAYGVTQIVERQAHLAWLLDAASDHGQH